MTITMQYDYLVVAQKEIFFEKTVNVKQNYLLDIMSNIENYPKIIPDNINSVKLIEGEKGQASMNVGLGGINFDVKTQYTILPVGSHFIEVLEGDLKGTKLTTTLTKTWGFDGTKDGGTIVKMKLSLEISGVLSLVTAFAPDESILFALDSSLIKFVNHAKAEQDYNEIVIPALQSWTDFEKISFWFRDFSPENVVKFYLRGDRFQTGMSFLLETDSTEWKKFEIPLTSFSIINLEKVRGISFVFDDKIKDGNFAIDDIVLSSSNKEEKLVGDDMTSLFNLHRSNSLNSILIQDSDDDPKVGKSSTKVQTVVVEGSTTIYYDFAYPGKKGSIKELKPIIPAEKFEIDFLTMLGILAVLAVVMIFVLYLKRKRQKIIQVK